MTCIFTLPALARLILAVALTISFNSISAAELDSKAISIKLPEQINWVANPGGSESAVLVGDPSKPGLYVILNKWKAHHNSKPHSHPNDRFITVISGTWWVGTGENYNGAKDGDTILQIVGIGLAH